MKKISEELKKMYEKQQETLEIEILKKAGCKDLKEFQEKWLKVKFIKNNLNSIDEIQFEIIYPE